MARSTTLVFTAALLISTTFAAAAATTNCPNCGTTEVPYPLSTGPNCGDQSYKVLCDTTDNSLKFETLNNTYPIASISPQIQRFVIQPSPFLPNTCVTQDLSTLGIQMNSSLPFNITSSNTIMYLNCTTLLLSSPLNCTSTSLCHTYANATAGACQDAPICCTFQAGGSTTSYMIRVRDSGCRAYTSYVNLDYGLAVNRWPQPGLEIQWVSPPEPVCGSQADCDSNSTCGADPSENGVRRCYCNSGLYWDPIDGSCAEIVTCQNPDGCGNSTDRTALIAGLTSGLGTALVASVIGILLYKRHRLIKEAQDRLTREREAILNANGGGRSAKIFSGKEIKRATNNFSRDRLLGAGGYGEVYKGFLNDGTIVAVKCAKLGNTKSTDQVLNEVRILCQVNHRSLVGILGCCVELEQPLLVYEYVPHGNLHEHLHGPNRSQISDADDVNLAVYVGRMVEEERIVDAVDPMLKEGASELELETMKALGFLAVGCLEERRQNRPSMKEVVEEIEYIISLASAKVVVP
ncbi:hypothetical protein Vadar_031536 [Vaccinium darrowii]|uniref:Uncharacterized protein n=1 Tax=Vaccinium darrowii TaxID=229202 RepID=A0ACB7YS49_9ERIC|nr:hypothetical protein Vadar_031536 [Vaccinium darrowii]